MTSLFKQIKKLFGMTYLILTLDCEDSAELTSEGFDRPLDWAERTALVLHRMICGQSRRLHNQMEALHDKLEDRVATAVIPELSQDARERILKSITDQTETDTNGN